MVFQLGYVSTAVTPWSGAQLLDLLSQSRVRNAACGVTGMLLHRDDRFLQLLEGDRSTVTGLYAQIAADPRHREVRTVVERRRVLRQFASWTMAFRDLGSAPFDLPELRDVLELPADAAASTATVPALVARLRPPSAGRSVVHGSRVLGLVSC